MKYSKWVMQSYFKELAFTRSLLNITAWNWTYALKKVLAFQSSCMSSDAPPCQALSPFFTTSEQLYCSVILSFRFGSTSFCFDKADIAALKGSTCMHLVLKVLFFLLKKWTALQTAEMTKTPCLMKSSLEQNNIKTLMRITVEKEKHYMGE